MTEFVGVLIIRFLFGSSVREHGYLAVLDRTVGSYIVFFVYYPHNVVNVEFVVRIYVNICVAESVIFPNAGLRSFLERYDGRISHNGIGSVYEITLTDYLAGFGVESYGVRLINDRVRFGHLRNFGVLAARIVSDVPLATIVQFVKQSCKERKFGSTVQISYLKCAVLIFESYLVDVFKSYIKVFFENDLVTLIENIKE